MAIPQYTQKFIPLLAVSCRSWFQKQVQLRDFHSNETTHFGLKGLWINVLFEFNIELLEELGHNYCYLNDRELVPNALSGAT